MDASKALFKLGFSQQQRQVTSISTWWFSTGSCFDFWAWGCSADVCSLACKHRTQEVVNLLFDIFFVNAFSNTSQFFWPNQSVTSAQPSQPSLVFLGGSLRNCFVEVSVHSARIYTCCLIGALHDCSPQWLALVGDSLKPLVARDEMPLFHHFVIEACAETKKQKKQSHTRFNNSALGGGAAGCMCLAPSWLAARWLTARCLVYQELAASCLAANCQLPGLPIAGVSCLLARWLAARWVWVGGWPPVDWLPVDWLPVDWLPGTGCQLPGCQLPGYQLPGCQLPGCQGAGCQVGEMHMVVETTYQKCWPSKLEGSYHMRFFFVHASFVNPYDGNGHEDCAAAAFAVNPYDGNGHEDCAAAAFAAAVAGGQPSKIPA